jgi:hypothetical protein
VNIPLGMGLGPGAEVTAYLIFSNVSNIDHRLRNSEAYAGSITAPPSAIIGDRESGNAPAFMQGDHVTSSQQFWTAIERLCCSRWESGNAPAFMQGDHVTSSQQFWTAIERLRCSRCQTRMMLERVSPGPIGFEHRLFECPKCDHVEIGVIASDPFKSKAAGWLSENSERRAEAARMLDTQIIPQRDSQTAVQAMKQRSR